MQFPIKLLVTGNNGAGKDTFAATAEKPLLLLHLDCVGAERPYYAASKSVGDIQSYVIGNNHFGEEVKIRYRDLVAKDGGAIRVEYWRSDDLREPWVAGHFETRLRMLRDETWKTVVIGSLSALTIEALSYEEFVSNSETKDQRQWYQACTKFLERVIVSSGALLCNVIMLCHIQLRDVADEGVIYRLPQAPGRLATNIGQFFSEIVRVYVEDDEHGNPVHLLQTRQSGKHIAKNHVNAPNPCEPTWKAFWSNSED